MAGLNLLIKKRLLFILFIISILMLALLLRVAWIQIVQGDWFQRLAFEQQTSGLVINPKRGGIFDRNGKEMAISASVETISANPQEVRKSKLDSDIIAQELSQILGVSKDDVLKRITKASRYEIIKTKVDKEIGDKVRKWKQEKKVPGIYIYEDTKRFYPNRNLAAHVIGFTGADNQGIDGVEKMMDQYLKGTPGKILSEVDAGGRGLPFREEKHIAPQDGLNVVLTIDETIQYFAQKALERAVDDNKVIGGAAAIVMDPRNGEILALVSKPDFDLNDPFGPPPGVDPKTWNGRSEEGVSRLQKTVWRDKAVVDTYEPGSTFKAFTSAAALEEKVIRPDSPVNDFTVTVGGWKINCWKPNAHGNETFTQGVYNSCNPVFVRVAQSLGIDRFYKYMRAFGFYEKTNLGLSGEATSIIHPKPTEVDMASASFGQRFQITPIQLISGYAAIANGGKLLRPHIVKELSDTGGNVVRKFEPEVIRNVISKQTAETLRIILEGVVSEGTGSNAYIKGYRVAGKTGTSQTTTPGRYIASFAAFAPAENPVICVLVVLDHPTGETYYGGQIAAPVAGRIVEDTLNYLNIERKYTEKDKELMMLPVYVPDVRNKTVEEAKKILSDFGLVYKLEGNGDNKAALVMEQTPKPNASIPEKSVVILYTYKPVKEIMVKVPDLLNKTISEATQALNDVGLNIRVNGLGTAVKQSVKPGNELPKGETVVIDFRYLDTE